MKNILKKQKNIILVLLIALIAFSGITYAASQQSNVKIGRTLYVQGRTGADNPPVRCDVFSTSDGTNVTVSFISAKRAGKVAFVDFNFDFTADEYDNLMSGDTLTFEHDGGFTSFDDKVFFTFFESSGMASSSKIISTSLGSPIGDNPSYLVMGTAMVLNKRADGCLDLSFEATAQNADLTKSTTTLDPSKKCVKDSHIEKLKTIPSVTLSGNLYPQKFAGSDTGNTSGSSTNGLCNFTSTSGAPSTSGSPVSSSGFTIPDFGSSSGFTIPDFGSSSGFTFPGLPGGEI